MRTRRRPGAPRLLIVALVSSVVAAAWVTGARASTPPDAAAANASWARVLERFVDHQGRVDFQGLAEDRVDLDRYVSWVASTSPERHPERFPDAASRLAFYLNSYNALSMHGVLETGIPRSLDGFMKVSFFVLRHVVVGGRSRSLLAYENDVIRTLGEPRVHFALNCMAVSCPRLPRKPFTAQNLDAELEREALRFFAEPRNLMVDAQTRTITFNEILAFFPEDFLAVAPSLAAYANRYALDPVPLDYQVQFRPYDWGVNAQP